MQLDTFIETKNLTVAQFAHLAGLSVQAVYKYLNGERTPNKKATAKIYQATNGLVDANSIHGLEPLKRSATKRKPSASQGERATD